MSSSVKLFVSSSVKLCFLKMKYLFTLFHAPSRMGQVCVMFSLNFKNWTGTNACWLLAGFINLTFSVSGAYSKYAPINLKSMFSSLTIICPVKNDLA